MFRVTRYPAEIEDARYQAIVLLAKGLWPVIKANFRQIRVNMFEISCCFSPSRNYINTLVRMTRLPHFNVGQIA